MITTRLETITPAQAKKWLEKMIHNRPLSQAKSLEYAIAMDEGKWCLNGETIKFTDGGLLFDGQHRLAACVLAEKPFKSNVVRGVDDEMAFATVDVGRARTHGDIFAIAGYPSPNVASGGAHIIYLIKRDMMSITGIKQRRYSDSEVKKSRLLQTLKNKPIKATHVTKEDLLNYCEPFKAKLVDCIRFTEKLRGKSKLLSPSQLAGLYYLFREKDEEAARQFIVDVHDGVGLAAHDPVYRLRERLIANHASNNKLTRFAVLFLTIKAWAKRRSGEKVGTLKIAENEQFPRIV